MESGRSLFHRHGTELKHKFFISVKGKHIIFSAGIALRQIWSLKEQRTDQKKQRQSTLILPGRSKPRDPDRSTSVQVSFSEITFA